VQILVANYQVGFHGGDTLEVETVGETVLRNFGSGLGWPIRGRRTTDGGLAEHPQHFHDPRRESYDTLRFGWDDNRTTGLIGDSASVGRQRKRRNEHQRENNHDGKDRGTIP
jgi:hypothetical protein